jgi:hypothetical protein
MNITYIQSSEKCVSAKEMKQGLFYRNIRSGDGRDDIYYVDYAYALMRLNLRTLHSSMLVTNVDDKIYYPVVVTADITVKDL